MKHFVTLIQDNSTAACFSYDSKPEAMGKFHTEMAYAMSQGVTTLCAVMNENGAIIANEKHTAPIEDGES